MQMVKIFCQIVNNFSTWTGCVPCLGPQAAFTYIDSNDEKSHNSEEETNGEKYAEMDIQDGVLKVLNSDETFRCPFSPGRSEKAWLQVSGRSLAKIVEQRAIKNRVQYIHCR
jgi:hypothetical protein